jgi:hypothetical protein
MLADVADLIINPAKIRANECSIGLLFPGLNLFSESTCDDVEILALFRLLKGGKTKVLVGDWSIAGMDISPSAMEERGEDIEVRGDPSELAASDECGAISVAILVNIKVKKVKDTLRTGADDNISRTSACCSSMVSRFLALSRAEIRASMSDHSSDVITPSRRD